jgi:hypothetical protein
VPRPAEVEDARLLRGEPSIDLARQQRLSRARSAGDDHARVALEHVEVADLLLVEGDVLVVEHPLPIAEREHRRPRLAPERVQRVDPSVIDGRFSAKDVARHVLEGGIEVSEILMAEHRVAEIAVRGLGGERRVWKRARDGDPRHLAVVRLLEATPQHPLVAVRLLTRHAVHPSPVLRPLPIAARDEPALHLDDEHAPLGDREDEVALSLERPVRAHAQRVPRRPPLRELRAKRREEVLLRLRARRPWRAAWVEPGGVHRSLRYYRVRAGIRWCRASTRHLDACMV